MSINLVKQLHIGQCLQTFPQKALIGEPLCGIFCLIKLPLTIRTKGNFLFNLAFDDF